MARGQHARVAASQRVGDAQRPQFVEQGKRGAVAHRMGFKVGDRQGEAGPLEQAASVADIDHRRHAGRDAAKDFNIGGKERIAQFGERATADGRGDQKPIGGNVAAQVFEKAGDVVDGLQVKERDDQVVIGGGQAQMFGVGRGKAIDFEQGRDFLEMDRATGRLCRVGQKPWVGAHDQRLWKFPRYRREPVGEVGDHQIGHEIGLAFALGEIGGKAGAVENEGGLGHGSDHMAQEYAPCNDRIMVGAMENQGRPFALRLRALVVSAGARALDLAFPPVCLACNEAVLTPDGLCPACWAQLIPISRPFCPVLGLPFASEMGEGALSVQAIANPPPFDRARSAVAYTDLARKLVSKMKYSDRPEIALFCARMMVSAGHELLGPDAVLVPVPLHRARQRERRYNQSAELARAIGRLAKCELHTDLIVRHRRTIQQVGLNASQRARNVDGAFGVDTARLERLGARRVVLVDDVLTTGATVSAAARALKRAGVSQVDVLSFARVVFDADMTV